MSMIYAELQHPNFDVLVMPIVYTFSDIDIFLKSKVIAVEQDFSLEKCDDKDIDIFIRSRKDADDKKFIFRSDKEFGQSLKSSSMREIMKKNS